VGVLSHELMLICLPALWLDKALGGTLSGGARYRHRDLALLAASALAALWITRHVVRTLPAQESYATTSGLELAASALRYSGGPVKHALRIYASLGPALLYALFHFLPRRPGPDAKDFAGLFLVAVTATFLAHDTLRVMEIVYFPVLLYATAFLEQHWLAGGRFRASVLIGIQLAWAGVVYGHLRTFEASHVFNLVAAGLSALALGLGLLWLRPGPTGGRQSPLWAAGRV
jgi:hypothetical protein